MRKRTGYLVKRGKVYYAAWQIEGKKFMRSTGCRNREEAEVELRRIMEPFISGDSLAVLESLAGRIEGRKAEVRRLDEERNPPPEIGRIWLAFMNSPGRPDSGDNTLRQYESEWRRFVSWLTREHPSVEHLHEVTPAIAAGYARDLTAAKVSASTYNQHRNLLRLVWRVMSDECRLDGNPWDKITPRKLNKLAGRKRALTQGQFENLLAVSENDPDLHDLFTLLAWTGLRLADAVLLKWSAIDFPNRVISLAPIKTARRQGKVVHIPLFPAAAAVLDKRQSGKVLNPAAYVFPDLAAVYEHDSGTLSKRITAAFEAAGMQTTEKRADRGRGVVVYGAHSLRHFFVTAATAAGMPAAMIKTITGHATDGMLEHYQQIGSEIASELATRINGAGNAAKLPALPALPPPDVSGQGGEEIPAQATLDAFRAKVQEIAETLTATNADEVRAALLSLTVGRP